MQIQRLAAGASAVSAAAMLLLGAAVPAQAAQCPPGLAPAVLDGVQTCAVVPAYPADPASPYNPGESHWDPVTGNYSEAVPGVPVPAESAAAPAPVPVAPSPSPAATGGAAVLPAPAVAPSPSPSRTPAPTPSAEPAAEEERTGMDVVLPAVAAVVILGLLAGALLRRHRNRRG